ncbi:unnamed protein product, partial [Scytosiphon promiscuus]
MSTSQRDGPGKNSKRKSSGSGSGSNGSSRAPSLRRKQRVGTPGRGVPFRAATLPIPRGAKGASREREDGGRAAEGGVGGSNSGGSESDTEGVFSYDEVADLATATPQVPKRSIARAADSGGIVRSQD